MKLKNQSKQKNLIPGLNKEIISKMDVSNQNGAGNKHKNDSNKNGHFPTIPTGFTFAANY